MNAPTYTAMVTTMLAAAAFIGNAHAAQVYRCVTGGTVTYSDVPCPPGTAAPGKPPKRDGTAAQSSVVAIPEEPVAGPYGGWTGQAQFQATAKGQSLEAAHAVVNLVISIAPDGRLTGTSKDNGCRALGVAAPSSPQVMKLDVSLSACSYAGYNRRYTGTFGVPPGQGYAALSLISYDARPETPSVTYDVKATMRR